MSCTICSDARKQVFGPGYVEGSASVCFHLTESIPAAANVSQSIKNAAVVQPSICRALLTACHSYYL